MGFVGRALAVVMRTQRRTHLCSSLPSDARHIPPPVGMHKPAPLRRLGHVTLPLIFVLLTFASPTETTTIDAAPKRESFERGGYFTMGVAPAATMYRNGFAPALRYDVESGFSWTRRHVRLTVGADAHLLQYFGRKKLAGGVDAMLTTSYRMVYVRAGLGVMAGMPATRVLDDALPAIGGVVGIGLQTWGDHVGGRIGVDYDFRVDTAGRPIQTFLLSLRITFG